MPREDLVVFAKGQPAFLRHYKFYTKEAENLFTQKEENILFIEKQIKYL